MRLKVIPNEGSPFMHRLEGDQQMIGRSFSAAVKLPDRSLSRKHARFFERDGHWYVEDLGSQNGTMVNGRLIDAPVPLQEGDRLKIGSSEIHVLGEQVKPAEKAIKTESSGVYKSASDVLAGTTSSGIRFAAASHYELRRLAQQLALMNEVHQSLSGPMTIQQAFEKIIDELFQYLEPEEGAVYLRQIDGTLECAASRLQDGTDHGGPLYSQHLVEQVMERGMAATVVDVELDERFSEAASIISRGVRSLVAAPMMASEEAIGMIVLSSSLRSRQFQESDMELLTSMASVAAMKVVNERLAQQVLERERFEQELALARKIQMTLLPSETPEMEGWQIHGRNRPSREVSGDFFRVVGSPDGSRGVAVVADVSGKGFAAAMLTASLEALLLLPIEIGMAPSEMCAVVSRQLHERTTPERFTTAIVCEIDRVTGTVNLASAGHNPVLHIKADGSHRWFAATGIPLGLLHDASYDEVDLVMEPGDVLVLYTDGITEARNGEHDEFGEERLLETVRDTRTQTARAISGELERRVEAFASDLSFDDDRTIVVVKRL